MPAKVLITGGAGFIGSNLALSLLARGHAIVVLDKLTPQIHGKNPERSPLYERIRNRVKFVHGDVACREDLLKVLPGIDIVVHLAAETGTGQSMYAIQHYAHVNVGGTALILDLIANERYPVRRLVVASSRAVYGEGKYHCLSHGVHYPKARADTAMANGQFEHLCPACQQVMQAVPTDERAALHPSSVYGVTKLTQEQLVLSVAQAMGISALAFRYQNVYGPGQSLSNPYTGIISIFSTRIRQNKPVTIFEDGEESRDFVYIDDVVDATIRGIEHPEQLVEVLNVGSGVASSVLNVANTLRKYLDGNSKIAVSGQFRAGDIRHNVADLKKVSGLLGFSPSVSFNDGIRRFTDWVRSQDIAPDRYEVSMQELLTKGLLK